MSAIRTNSIIPVFPPAATWLIGFLTALLVSIPTAVWLLVGMMMFDYATGWLAAATRHELDSDIGWHGLVKKVLTMLLVGSVYFFAYFAGSYFGGGQIAIEIGSITALAFAANEFISVVENCSKAGLKIPPALLGFLKKIELGERWDGADRRAGSDLSFPGPERRKPSP